MTGQDTRREIDRRTLLAGDPHFWHFSPQAAPGKSVWGFTDCSDDLLCLRSLPEQHGRRPVPGSVKPHVHFSNDARSANPERSRSPSTARRCNRASAQGRRPLLTPSSIRVPSIAWRRMHAWLRRWPRPDFVVANYTGATDRSVQIL
jgi:hypothetical protein